MITQLILEDNRIARTRGLRNLSSFININEQASLFENYTTSFYPHEEEIENALNKVKVSALPVSSGIAWIASSDIVISSRNYLINLNVKRNNTGTQRLVQQVQKHVGADKGNFPFPVIFSKRENEPITPSFVMQHNMDGSYSPEILVLSEAIKIDEKIKNMVLLNTIKRYDMEGKYVRGLKLLFKEIISLIKQRDFNQIDSIIIEFIKIDFNIKTYIGFLSITKGIKRDLERREDLISNIFKIAIGNGYSNEEAENLIFEPEQGYIHERKNSNFQ
jgi:hypothetical protein